LLVFIILPHYIPKSIMFLNKFTLSVRDRKSSRKFAHDNRVLTVSNCYWQIIVETALL